MVMLWLAGKSVCGSECIEEDDDDDHDDDNNDDDDDDNDDDDDGNHVFLGISVCGSGVGTFIFAPLATWLLEQWVFHHQYDADDDNDDKDDKDDDDNDDDNK